MKLKNDSIKETMLSHYGKGDTFAKFIRWLNSVSEDTVKKEIIAGFDLHAKKKFRDESAKQRFQRNKLIFHIYFAIDCDHKSVTEIARLANISPTLVNDIIARILRDYVYSKNREFDSKEFPLQKY